MYRVISDNKKMETELKIENLKIAILVNLYYEDQVSFCRAYLERIPVYIDIFIISSKDEILHEFREERYQKVKKENRGRDISALLIAAKDVIFRYQYVCFVHDKREREPDIKEYVNLWRRNLWDNMLQSDIYVYNLIGLLASDSKIGMFVPLPPHGKLSSVWLNGSWGDNYENMRNIADELNVNVDICREDYLISYSTVFWVKTQALHKLYLREWKYSDFPDEPMKIDGEINHAIERILQYIVEDAGYETKISLSSSFVGMFLEQLSSELKELWDRLDVTIGIKSYRQLDSAERIKKFRKKYADIYLYGNGKVGKECMKICEIINIVPMGIIVTDPEKECNRIYNMPIIGFF